MVTLVATLNTLDTGLIALLLQPIKEDLHLSDTQLGTLTGIAFGLFYATAGLPIARWADRGNRVSIICVATLLWGATMMSCLLVTNFLQLALTRLAAGIGQSGCMPPTYSLLADFFPSVAGRARAQAVYWLNSSLSSLIAFVFGGWLSERFGWRVLFFMLGVPAIVVALLTKMTIKDPRTKRVDPQPAKRALAGALQVLTTLWRRPASKHLMLAIILMWILGYGLAPWYAAFMMRVHGMSTWELGIWLGVILGICSVAGTLLGGYVAAHWRVHDERTQTRLRALSIAAQVPLFVAFLLWPSKHGALIALMPAGLLGGFYIGPTFGLLQRLVEPEARAMAFAIVMLFANLIGMGVGPESVGLLSDWLTPMLGTESLRYAMLCMQVTALWAAYHCWQIGATVNADLAAAARSQERAGDGLLRTGVSS
jgi:MFS family permease